MAAARKVRETDPVLPLLDDCLRRADSASDSELRERLASLLAFTHQFDRGINAVVRSDSAAVAHLFEVLDRLDDATLDRLVAALVPMPADELARAATSVASMRSQFLRRLIRLASQPGIARLLAGIGR